MKLTGVPQFELTRQADALQVLLEVRIHVCRKHLAATQRTTFIRPLFFDIVFHASLSKKWPFREGGEMDWEAGSLRTRPLLRPRPPPGIQAANLYRGRGRKP